VRVSKLVQNTNSCGQITMQNIPRTKTHETMNCNNINFFSLIFFHLYRTRSKANLGNFVEQGKDWKIEGQSKKKIKRMGGDF